MKAFRFLVYPIVALLLVVLAVVVFIPVLVYLLYRLLEAMWFRYSNRGRVFLVYTRRHGWNEFLCNNLFPAIAPDIVPVEYARGREPWPRLLSHIYSPGYSKPFLAKVSWSGVRYFRLHELLLPLKRHGERREDMQAELRQMLAAQVGSGAR
ncbi:MAG TPA: hypothetical protein VHK01_17130 [Lacipirellulaceae bacterium]|jgi:hypothetical protein|nr:hypothetical protein [Lacipirellulaceae bacterium]